MRGVNKVILIGNATRAVECRQTGSGKPVSNIRLATNRQVKGGETTQFHTVVCWDRLAEITAEYVKKGDPLYVEGRLEYRSFHDEGARSAASVRSSPVMCSFSAPVAVEPDLSQTWQTPTMDHTHSATSPAPAAAPGLNPHRPRQGRDRSGCLRGGDRAGSRDPGAWPVAAADRGSARPSTHRLTYVRRSVTSHCGSRPTGVFWLQRPVDPMSRNRMGFPVG
jgi:single-strand DNA-binding protein